MRQILCLLGLACFVGAAGCGAVSADSAAMAGSGEFGATQGGVQDMSFARALVAEGRVPPAEAFIVEAMYSEHDLPIEGAPCTSALCLRAAMGVAPDQQGSSALWTQIGMSSTIDPATFQRPSLAIVATVDVSGSMGWDYGEGAVTPASITHALLHSIAAKLEARDRFSLVAYGTSVVVSLDWTVGNDPLIATAIDGLGESGSTNMEAGLETAYAKARAAQGSADEVRVMLFTDVQPNVGATSASAFSQIAADGAAQGAGLTVFGVGLGMGAEVLKAMSELRGGNAFSLVDPEAVPDFMDDNWPWLACPIAYDLKLTASSVPPMELRRSYGFPGSGEASMEVASVFLSKRRGGMLLEFGTQEPVESGRVALNLEYADRSGEVHRQMLDATYEGQALDELGRYLPQTGLRRAVPLALLVSAMHDAAELYGSDPVGAIALLEPALARFEAEAAGDPELEAEATFWPALLTLMKQGAPLGDLYPR